MAGRARQEKAEVMTAKRSFAHRDLPLERRGQVIVLSLLVLLHPFLLILSEAFLSPVQEVFLLCITIFISFLTFVMTESYLCLAILGIGGLIANCVGSELQFFLQDRYLHGFTYELSFRIGLMWACGYVIMLAIRILSTKKWDTTKIRQTFKTGFSASNTAFLVFYIALLLSMFIFQRRIDWTGERSLNLIPFHGAFAVYWPYIKQGIFNNGIFVQFFGNLLIFTPLGFFIALYKKKKSLLVMVLFPIFLATLIEGTQYLLNTGKSDIDDLWMNVIGFWLGVHICFVLETIRKWITHGKESTIML
ncbi:MAG TPA: VanZ family protein [Bacillota bacterium]|nr:VanZ family protein [Bacillota bacterium]